MYQIRIKLETIFIYFSISKINFKINVLGVDFEKLVKSFLEMSRTAEVNYCFRVKFWGL